MALDFQLEIISLDWNLLQKTRQGMTLWQVVNKRKKENENIGQEINSAT